MTITKTYWLYGDHEKSGGIQNAVLFTTYENARATGDAWVAKGMVLVHIREQIIEERESNTCGEHKIETLVWAAASPEVDWR